MPDLRAPAHLIGMLVAALGAAMLAPMTVDLLDGDPNWRAFAEAAFITAFIGLTVARAADTGSGELGRQQVFLLTVMLWTIMPIFGGLPFILGAPGASAVDAFFEAMSGLTTTGSTVFVGLGDMPRGVLLWRGMLQWFGGIGVVVVAVAFLPELKVGGMQLFRSEGFETFGKILPRAREIAASISSIYVGLTAACMMGFAATGMSLFDALVHAMTTIATGGFANDDLSFAAYPPAAAYVCVLFMLLACLPFVRYVQLVGGEAAPLLRDPQVLGFLGVTAAFVLAVGAARAGTAQIESLAEAERAAREALFNMVSVITGSGFTSTDYGGWGPFAVASFFIGGLIGGCAGSTTCSIKVFRYQILLAVVASQVRRIHSPHAVAPPRWGGRPVTEEVISSVMAFFFMFLLSLAVVSIALGMLGLDALTAVSGAATALANVGPGLGPIIGPTGNFEPLSDAAKWVLAFAMLVGRLELMAVFVLATTAFWQR